MLYIKMMSNEDCPDSDAWKNYKIIPIGDADTFSFYKSWKDGGDVPQYVLSIERQNGQVTCDVLTGNVYVMNEAGKTIASHGC